MSKKKKRKQEKKKNKELYVELNGMILILLSIIALGPFGWLGDILSKFSQFLVGSWYVIVPLSTIVLGIYLMIKKAWPNFYSSKLIGFYFLIITITVWSHVNHGEENLDIISRTWEQITLALSRPGTIPVGGGMIGSIFLSIISFATGKEGAKIVTLALMIFAIMLITGKSLTEFIIKVSKKIYNFVSSKRKKNLEKVKEAEQEFEKGEGQIIISSIDDLLKKQKEEVEIKEESIQPETISETPKDLEEKHEFLEMGDYQLPPINILKRGVDDGDSIANQKTITEVVEKLESLLRDFGINSRVVAANVGPTVTQYELEITSGTKVSRVVSLNREIAIALAAKDVRIQAPIPGKHTIGIEIPNEKNKIVTLREVLETIENFDKDKLIIGLGRDIKGQPIHADLSKMPHLLVAGATGSGKSICINSIIISLLMHKRPDELKFVLIDPKIVELSYYDGLPHLLMPVVTDPKKASIALKKIIQEMEHRYELFAEIGCKNIAGYNAYVGREKKLPFIVVIIDELSDLMLVAAKEVEESIMRITQMARAAGIHLIAATQRPSADIITGLIKANIPSRIAFSVSSSIDSRTILDMTGAEKLIGKGDMLFLPMGQNVPIRIQGSYVSEMEIKQVVDYVKKQQKVEYDENMMKLEIESVEEKKDFADEEDVLYEDAVKFVIEEQEASASRLQRRFKIGYNRAARLIDIMEARGIVGPKRGSKPREVLVKLNEQE